MLSNGELSERLKEHDWKSCRRLKRLRGSNPRLSARSHSWRLRAPRHLCGGVAEWLNAAVSKTVYPPPRVRGFESPLLRQSIRRTGQTPGPFFSCAAPRSSAILGGIPRIVDGMWFSRPTPPCRCHIGIPLPPAMSASRQSDPRQLARIWVSGAPGMIDRKSVV